MPSFRKPGEHLDTHESFYFDNGITDTSLLITFNHIDPYISFLSLHISHDPLHLPSPHSVLMCHVVCVCVCVYTPMNFIRVPWRTLVTRVWTTVAIASKNMSFHQQLSSICRFPEMGRDLWASQQSLMNCRLVQTLGRCYTRNHSRRVKGSAKEAHPCPETRAKGLKKSQ